MITLQEYQARRQKLASQLPVNSIAVIPAAMEALRNGDVYYPFRQDSDFYYLTGFNESDALLVIISGAQMESILFSRARDTVAEQWTGRRLGQEDACAVLGVQGAYALADLELRLPELLADKKYIYYAIGRFPIWDERIQRAWQIVSGRVRQGVNAPEAFYSLVPILSEMRLLKSTAEIALMQQAADISIRAHEHIMQVCKNCKYEYELAAELLYIFQRAGCRSVAYDSIVAGGANACVLHYTNNNQALHSGELVLVDAGCEVEYYASDITRTFPINGKFSKEQCLIYELVLQAQRAGIECIRPGVPWEQIQETIVKTLVAGMVDLKILRGTVDELIEGGVYKSLYMHQSGHWLGLDVHDVGKYKVNGKSRLLEPNMVLTVEPGIYIQPGLECVDSRFWGIGVRIEDDLLVTDTGHKNLTQALASDVAAIEALVCG